MYGCLRFAFFSFSRFSRFLCVSSRLTDQPTMATSSSSSPTSTQGVNRIKMYYKIKYGLDELPKGEEMMGSYTKKIYTREQQIRLGVDKEGNKVPRRTFETSPDRATMTFDQSNRTIQSLDGPKSKLVQQLSPTNRVTPMNRATMPAKFFPRNEEKQRNFAADTSGRDFDVTVNDTQNISPTHHSLETDVYRDDETKIYSSSLKASRRRIELRPVRLTWIRAQKLKFIAKLTSEMYSFYHFYLCFIPSIMFAVVAGVMALLITAENIEESHLGTTVGILAVLSAMWQCISSQLGLDSKAREYMAASESYQTIENDCLMHYQDSDVSAVRKLLELVNHGLQSNPPLRISQAFELMDSRMLQQTHTDDVNVSDDQIVNVRVSIIRELYCTLSRYRFWPVLILDPTQAVEEAMRRYREPLEREISNGTGKKYDKYTIGDLFSIRSARSLRVMNRVVPVRM